MKLFAHEGQPVWKRKYWEKHDVSTTFSFGYSELKLSRMKIIGIKNNTFKIKLTSSGSKVQSPPDMERIYLWHGKYIGRIVDFLNSLRKY